jgi:hypothetical protein
VWPTVPKQIWNEVSLGNARSIHYFCMSVCYGIIFVRRSRLGYRLGMCSILALWVCWDCVWGLVKDGNSTIGGRTAFPVFRGCGGLLLLHWCWGIRSVIICLHVYGIRLRVFSFAFDIIHLEMILSSPLLYFLSSVSIYGPDIELIISFSSISIQE